MTYVIEIGSPGWERRLRALRDADGADPWVDLKPWAFDDVVRVESALQRKLPVDLVMFLTTFGCGYVGSKGFRLYAPDDMIGACIGPLYVFARYSDRIPEVELHDFFVRRGEGPYGHRIGVPNLELGSVGLFDLVQIGADGCTGYQLVDTSVAASGYYCAVDCSVYRAAPTMSPWLERALKGDVDY